MRHDGGSVYIAFSGQVERVDVAEVSLEALRQAVSARFGIGESQLRFHLVEEDVETEVATDDELRSLVQQRQTLRVAPSDAAIAELEQRMGQLRQLQSGFLREEIARLRGGSQGLRGEVRQLRQLVEQAARREVELTSELLGERGRREQAEQAVAERLEAFAAELHREQRAREVGETALRREMEEARQMILKFAAASEKQVLEVRSALAEETRSRGKSVEALLSEWAGSQAEVRQAIESVRSDVERGMQDSERHSKGLLREASAREAFEQFFGEKIRSFDLAMSALEGHSRDLEERLFVAVRETEGRPRCVATDRAASLPDVAVATKGSAPELGTEASGQGVLFPAAAYAAAVPSWASATTGASDLGTTHQRPQTPPAMVGMSRTSSTLYQGRQVGWAAG